MGKFRALGNASVSLDDEKKQILGFTFSDESVDRYGDIIRMAGWKNLRDFVQKGPSFLFAHDYRAPAIGKVLDVQKNYRGKLAIGGPVQYATEDVYPFAATMFKLSKPPDAFMRTVSVGFDPHQDKIKVPDADERKALGMGERGVIYEGQDLLEVSLVPVPANPNAVQDAYQKGVITDREQNRVMNFIDEIEQRFGVDIRHVACPAQEKSSCSCQEGARQEEKLFDTLSAIQTEIRSLSGKVEKLAGEERGRPEGKDGFTPPDLWGADLHATLLDQVEKATAALAKVKKT